MKAIKLFFISFLLFNSYLFAQTDNDVVVIQFENLLKKHFESYKTNQREQVSKLGGGWVKLHYKLDGDYKYDIQNSNSLITPYIGSCEFTLKELRTGFHQTKEEAQLDTIFSQSVLGDHKHEYSYQKGKWIVSKRQNGKLENWYDCNEVITEGENKGATNIYGCWEENFPECNK